MPDDVPLVERLQKPSFQMKNGESLGVLSRAAAAEIERLTAEQDRMKHDLDLAIVQRDALRSDRNGQRNRADHNDRRALAAEAERDTLRASLALARAALGVGERFVNACFSAWSCGEPPHRVMTMLDRADEFRAALASIPEDEKHGAGA